MSKLPKATRRVHKTARKLLARIDADSARAQRACGVADPSALPPGFLQALAIGAVMQALAERKIAEAPLLSADFAFGAPLAGFAPLSFAPRAQWTPEVSVRAPQNEEAPPKSPAGALFTASNGARAFIVFADPAPGARQFVLQSLTAAWAGAKHALAGDDDARSSCAAGLLHGLFAGAVELLWSDALANMSEAALREKLHTILGDVVVSVAQHIGAATPSAATGAGGPGGRSA